MSVYRPTYIHTDPATGKRTKRKLRKWYVKYRDANGCIQKVPGYTDREATKALETELQRKAARRQVGMTDPHEEHHKRPLAEHLEDYRRHMEAKNNCSEHITQSIAHCRAVFEGIAARVIGDLDADRVAAWLADRRRNHGMSISTSNHYTVSVKSFSKWLVTPGRRVAADPMTHLSRLNADTDIRVRRRDLNTDEARRLLQATLGSSETFRGLTGEDRFFLYGVAFQSGLRAGELSSLYPAAFELDTDPPTVKLQAAYAKNRKEVNQPLPLPLAEALCDYLASKRADSPVWPGTWHKVAFRMIARDLAAARQAWIAEAGDDAEERKKREQSDYLAYRDAEGRTFDFHATRHTFISLLAKSGVHPKMAQSLARHSSITLTMDRYTHVGLFDQAAALEALPPLPLLPVSEKVIDCSGSDRDGYTPSTHMAFHMAFPYGPAGDNSCLRVITPDNQTGKVA